MRYFIATIAPKLDGNWDICKRESMWGVVGRGTNWKKNLLAMEAGDRIFIWQGGAPANGFIAQITSLEGATLVGPTTVVPWPEPHRFGGTFRMRVDVEARPPLSDTFPNSNRRIGLRYGFNNTVLQHIFEEISSHTAERIAADFVV